MSDPPEPDALRIARDRATLGLPVPVDAKLRLAKRVVYKISWIFLRHQVEFNQRTVETLADVALDQQRLQETFVELSRSLEERLDFGLRHLHREIGDNVAALRSDLTHLQTQLEELSGPQSGPGRRGDTAASDQRL